MEGCSVEGACSATHSGGYFSLSLFSSGIPDYKEKPSSFPGGICLAAEIECTEYLPSSPVFTWTMKSDTWMSCKLNSWYRRALKSTPEASTILTVTLKRFDEDTRWPPAAWQQGNPGLFSMAKWASQLISCFHNRGNTNVLPLLMGTASTVNLLHLQASSPCCP